MRLEQITVVRLAEGGSVPPVRGMLALWPASSSYAALLFCPDCGKKAALASHTVTQHDDQTVSISAAVTCPALGCRAAYTIGRNKITWL